MQEENNEKIAQQERADEMRKQIDGLRSKDPRAPATSNPREFIAEKMKKMAAEKKSRESNDCVSREDTEI